MFTTTVLKSHSYKVDCSATVASGHMTQTSAAHREYCMGIYNYFTNIHEQYLGHASYVGQQSGA